MFFRYFAAGTFEGRDDPVAEVEEAARSKTESYTGAPRESEEAARKRLDRHLTGGETVRVVRSASDTRKWRGFYGIVVGRTNPLLDTVQVWHEGENVWVNCRWEDVGEVTLEEYRANR